MSLLIATPCYGGMVTREYAEGLADTLVALHGNLEHDVLLTSNESLVQRARNTITASFLKTDFQKLLFIDADIGFSARDVSLLWNLQKDVAVGLYRMKRPDAPLAAWRDGKMVTDIPSDPFEVDYAGTGFFMVDRDVLERMRDAFPEREHEEGIVGRCFSWFDPRVEGSIYLSEDYAFCTDWRSLGGKIIAHPEVKLKHIGRAEY